MPGRKNYIPRFFTVSQDENSPFMKAIHWLQTNYKDGDRVILAYQNFPDQTPIDPGEIALFDNATKVDDPQSSATYYVAFGAVKTKGKPGDPNSL